MLSNAGKRAAAQFTLVNSMQTRAEKESRLAAWLHQLSERAVVTTKLGVTRCIGENIESVSEPTPFGSTRVAQTEKIWKIGCAPKPRSQLRIVTPPKRRCWRRKELSDKAELPAFPAEP